MIDPRIDLLIISAKLEVLYRYKVKLIRETNLLESEAKQIETENGITTEKERDENHLNNMGDEHNSANGD